VVDAARNPIAPRPAHADESSRRRPPRHQG
jgi:hypothetical protein